MKWTICIPRWHPTPLNKLMRHWRAAARLKKIDREMVFIYAFRREGPHATPAKGKRRVSLTIILGPKQRAADPDAYQKSLGDALVHAGLLTDDNRQGVEWAPTEFRRGPEFGTEITLADLEDR